MNFKPIYAWQINLHHCRLAADTLAQNLSSYGAEYIAFIQEPYAFKSRVRSIPRNGKLFVGSINKPRSCILLSKNVHAWQLPQFSDRDTTVITMTDENKRTSVYASVYMPGDEDIVPASLSSLVEYCRTGGFPLLISADANAHHRNWGSTDTNNRGEALLEFMMANDIDCANVGTKPTFVAQDREEVLDVTLTTRTMYERVVGWHVSDEVSFSDHMYIRFMIKGKALSAEPTRNVRKTDWDHFEGEVGKRIAGFSREKITNVELIDNRIDGLAKVLRDSFNTACPIRYGKRRQNASWWNPELASAKKDLQRKRKYKRQDEEGYKEARKAYKYKQRKAKRKSWREYCHELTEFSPTARLVKTLSTERRKEVGMLKKADGTFTSSPDEALERLLEVHFPEMNDDVDVTNMIFSHEISDVNLAENIVTHDRVEFALLSFKPYKAAGVDGIYPAMLQKAHAHIVDLLVSVFRACITFGYVPKSWRKSRVVFLPKPGKDDYAIAKAFRPVSLTSSNLKALERLIYWYMQSTSLERHPFVQNQFAFRSGYSTDTAIHSLVARVETSMAAGEFAVAVFLDIEGAFDNATISSMVKGMRRHGVDEGLVRFITHMLCTRVAEAHVNGCKKSKRVKKGTPQGGVLSPALWNMIINELLMVLSQTSTSLYNQGYADDVVILQGGPDLETVRSLTQTALNIVWTWAIRNNLRFNPSKTEVIVFTGKCKWSFRIPLYFGGVELKTTKQAKYLGVILHEKLSWKPHVQAKTAKATKLLAACNRAVGKTWGLAPKIKKWIYTAIIRPMMTYGCLSWVGAVESSSIMSLLTKVQRYACVTITSAFPGTPTAAMEVLLNIPPMHIYLTTEATKTAHRLLRTGTWLGCRHDGTGWKKIASHTEICSKIINQIPCLNMDTDYIIPRLDFDIPIVFEIQDRATYTMLRTDDETNAIHAFTDGSKIGDETGSGFYAHDNENEIESCYGWPEYVTVFQAEILAISKLASCLLELNTTDRSVIIHSDSQAAIRALANPRKDKKTVIECMDFLRKLVRNGNVVQVCWIPGHSDYDGNERADQKAKEGTQMALSGAVPVPVAECQHRIHGFGENIFKAWWVNRTDCRQTRMYVSGPSKSIANALIRMPRDMLRMLIQIITGHANLARHRAITHRSTSPTCPACGQDEETPDHYVGKCPAFAEARSRDLGARTCDLVDLITPKELWSLGKFLRNTKHLMDFSYKTNPG